MNEIEVHQCLFGYQDGHRLLSTSMHLPQDAASLVLLLSDLAPGLSLPTGAGYWTGVPLPSAKSYALMRTWLAPEMPRPGCVWTHALIISFADIARFPDMSGLTAQVTRPGGVGGFERYAIPLSLLPRVGVTKQPEISQREGVQRVIRAIYSSSSAGNLAALLGELDSSIFAVWSQQWPRLRRTFSFRTAVSSADSLSSRNEFDLTVSIGSNLTQMIAPGGDFEGLEPWEKIAGDDVMSVHSTEFRRFLWRYGSDLRMGRQRFKFLTEMYLDTRSEKLQGKDLHRFITKVVKALPSVDEGKMLKTDLIGGNQYSMLPVVDSIDMLAFYIKDPIASKLPLLSAEAFEAIQDGWHTRSEEILSIAEIAAERETPQGARLLDQLASAASASSFLSSTESKPHLRKKFLVLMPSLLDSDDLVKASGAELLELLSYVPADELELMKRLLPRLLTLDDQHLANEMTNRFPTCAVTAAVAAIEDACLGEGPPVSSAWINSLREQRSQFLGGSIIERSKTTLALSTFASILGYAQSDVLSAGSIPWIKGLKNARDNVSGYERKRFLVFLLELALHKPVSGCESLFEVSFELIHENLNHSKLSWELSSELLDFLPTLGWLRNWDSCLRLRTAVVESYIRGNLDVISFKRLASGQLYKQLLDAAEDVKGGMKFLKRL